MIDYEPLLPKGDHVLTLEEVYTICVEDFSPNNDRREYLFIQFTDFLIYFRGLGFLPAEIWIDGSFVTKKPDPGDIDLLIILHMGEVALLSREVQDLLYSEFNDGPAKRKFDCEVLLAPSADTEMIKDRLRFFRNLSSRNTFKKKGIIKLRMP